MINVCDISWGWDGFNSDIRKARPKRARRLHIKVMKEEKETKNRTNWDTKTTKYTLCTQIHYTHTAPPSEWVAFIASFASIAASFPLFIYLFFFWCVFLLLSFSGRSNGSGYTWCGICTTQFNWNGIFWPTFSRRRKSNGKWQPFAKIKSCDDFPLVHPIFVLDFHNLFDNFENWI